MSARALIAAVPLLVMLTSCTMSARDLDGISPLTTASIQTRFSDTDPQDFGKVTPADYPIHGVDVSRWQGDIDWEKARRAGVSFAFVKATEGGDTLDPHFADYWRGARAAGIPVAPYHFYYFCTSPQKQADWFIRNVPKSAIVTRPVIDMEWNPRSPTCHKRPPASVVRRDLKIFAERIEAHYHKKPIIYTTIDFHHANLAGHFKGYNFWLRSVAAHPDDAYDDRGWTFWQYTGTGVVPGIVGPVDISVFSGNSAKWKTWLAAAGN